MNTPSPLQPGTQIPEPTELRRFDELGAEPLLGSGFEEEQPEVGFEERT